MKQRKGFTLIELIGVLVLLGVLAAIIFPVISRTIRDSRQEAYQRSVENIMKASHAYLAENKMGYNTEKRVLPLEVLRKAGLLEDSDIISPIDDEPMTGCPVYYWSDADNQYKFEYNENCEVSTDGSCFAFDEYSGTIYGYSSNCPLEISIPSKINGIEVKKINAYSFYNLRYYDYDTDYYYPITSVDFSNATYLEEIGSSAFAHNYISEINFQGASNLKVINSSAFANNSIRKLDFSGLTNLVRIEDSAFKSNYIEELDFSKLINLEYLSGFDNNNNLKSIYFGSLPKLKVIGSSAFDNWLKRSINEIDFSGLVNLEEIQDSAFERVGLTKLDLSNLTNLKYLSGFNSNSIVELKMPNNVTTIGLSAFQSNYIETLTLPNSVTTVNGSAFRNNKIKTLNLSSGLTTIGGYAFFGNIIETLSLPDGITSIYDNAFSSNKITSLTIPDSVKTIGSSAFASNQISALSIGNSVTSIGYGAFNDNLLPNSLAFIYQRDRNGVEDKTTIVSYGGVQKANVIIPDGVTNIYTNAFSNNKITSLTIPNDVKTIGSSAFANNQITSLTLGTGLTSIASYAFSTNRLTTVTIPNNIKVIQYNAFYYNNSLTSIEIDNTTNSISGSPWGATNATVKWLRSN